MENPLFLASRRLGTELVSDGDSKSKVREKSRMNGKGKITVIL